MDDQLDKQLSKTVGIYALASFIEENRVRWITLERFQDRQQLFVNGQVSGLAGLGLTNLSRSQRPVPFVNYTELLFIEIDIAPP